MIHKIFTIKITIIYKIFKSQLETTMMFIKSIIILLGCFFNVESVEELNKDVSSLTPYMKLAINGNYPGDKRVRFKYGRISPIYNQRTSFLYYVRKEVGEKIMWVTLAMGMFINLDEILFDKKRSFQYWEYKNPEEYKKIETNIPQTWYDSDNSLEGIEDDSIYVFKPSNQFGGDGILFIKGNEVENIVSSYIGSWVVQKFIEPFLYQNKKTHFRTITMGIIQPDGTHEFYIYDKMKLFLAPLDYNKDKLFDKDFMKSNDSHFMLTTNLMANKHLYSKTHGSMKSFDPWKVVLDLESSIGTKLFNTVYANSRDIHESVYTIINKDLKCKETEVSVYGDSCFYIFASDIAMDEYGSMYLLEINGGMGLFGVFKDEEIREMMDSAASLMEIPEFPYEKVDTSLWARLKV